MAIVGTAQGSDLGSIREFGRLDSDVVLEKTKVVVEESLRQLRDDRGAEAIHEECESRLRFLDGMSKEKQLLAYRIVLKVFSTHMKFESLLSGSARKYGYLKPKFRRDSMKLAEMFCKFKTGQDELGEKREFVRYFSQKYWEARRENQVGIVEEYIGKSMSRVERKEKEKPEAITSAQKEWDHFLDSFENERCMYYTKIDRSVQSSRRRWSMEELPATDSFGQHHGISNGQSICYMNAFLQTLLGSSEIVDFIEEQVLTDESPVMKGLGRFFDEHKRGISQIQPPLYLRDAVYDSDFGFGLHAHGRDAMQDSSEFAAALLNSIGYDNPYRVSYSGIVGGETLRSEPRRDPKPILVAGNGDGVDRLEEMIRMGANEHVNDEENQWHYEGNGVDVKLAEYSQHTRFEGEPPPLLIVQVNRFAIEFADGDFVVRKDGKKIQLPEDDLLDFSPYSEDGEVTYRLKGVVIHQGRSFGSGHYVAEVKHGDQWYHFNDSVCFPIRRESVHTEDGYLYLLERVDPEE